MRAAPAALAALCLILGCPHPTIQRAYPEPSSDELLAFVRGVRERAPSLRADTLSDAWIGHERAKGTVLMMATWGGRLRVMPIGPNNAMLQDFASDGQTICFLDVHRDCGDCGPATAENVGQILRLEMPPDDVVAALLGSTPVLADARGTVSWDAASGRELLDLVAADGRRQHVELAGRERSWDVLDSTLFDAKGKVVWRIRHGRFHAVRTARGDTVHMPGISMLTGPAGDVEIRWRKQEIGLDLPADKFRLDLAPGLSPCR